MWFTFKTTFLLVFILCVYWKSWSYPPVTRRYYLHRWGKEKVKTDLKIVYAPVNNFCKIYTICKVILTYLFKKYKQSLVLKSNKIWLRNGPRRIPSKWGKMWGSEISGSLRKWVELCEKFRLSVIRIVKKYNQYSFQFSKITLLNIFYKAFRVIFHTFNNVFK